MVQPARVAKEESSLQYTPLPEFPVMVQPAMVTEEPKAETMPAPRLPETMQFVNIGEDSKECTPLPELPAIVQSVRVAAEPLQ